MFSYDIKQTTLPISVVLYCQKYQPSIGTTSILDNSTPKKLRHAKLVPVQEVVEFPINSKVESKGVEGGG